MAGAPTPRTATVILGLQSDELTADQVASDHFAHEWGHTCYYSTGASGTNGCPSFGEEWVSGSSWDHGTHEFMAKSSEYFNGMVAEDWYGTFWEQPFTVGIGREDWYETCQKVPGGGHANGSDRRWIYFPFSAYLQDHFNDEGLLYDWIHWDETCTDSSNVGPHDFDYLAYHLGFETYGNSFSETTGDARLRELFCEYALSMWVNADHLIDDNPEASVHMPLHAGASPRDNFGFYKLKDDGYCQDDALSQPYYVDVDEDLTVVDSALYGSDFGCPYQDLFNFRRELTFDSYAFSILPFRAAEAVQASGRCYDLEVRVVLEDSVECFNPGEYREWDEADNDYLHFWVLGYPEHTDSLDIYGDEAVLVDEVAYNDNFAAGDTLAFTVPCFGSAFKAVALVASLTEVTASGGKAVAHVIPYTYSCWAEDKTGDLTISSNTTWEVEDGPYCLGGLLTVDGSATLSIDPGTWIWCADPDSSGVDEVGFAVEGRLAFNGDTEDGQVNVVPILDGWDAIEIADDGVLEASFLSVSGLSGLTCKYTAAKIDLSDCTITLGPDAAATGLDFSAADTVSIVDCKIHDASTVVLSDNDEMTGCELHQRAGSTWTAIQIDGDALLDDVLVYAARTAIKCLSGEATITNVSASSATTLSCASSPTYGLVVESGADADLANCTFDAFCTAVRLNGSGGVYMRDSEVIDAGDMGVYIPGKTATAELGYILSPPVAGMYGDNCIDTADSTDYRVYNRSSYTAMAVGNYWGTASPTSGLFYGSVAWQDSIATTCPGGTGGPDLSIVALPGASPRALALGQPVPNPFNPSCELKFTLPASGAAATLTIYDLSGRHLATLFSGRADGREHSLRWDGRDERGHPVSSGVYFAKLSIGSDSQSRKLVVLK